MYETAAHSGDDNVQANPSRKHVYFHMPVDQSEASLQEVSSVKEDDSSSPVTTNYFKPFRQLCDGLLQLAQSAENLPQYITKRHKI